MNPILYRVRVRVWTWYELEFISGSYQVHIRSKLELEFISGSYQVQTRVRIKSLVHIRSKLEFISSPYRVYLVSVPLLPNTASQSVARIELGSNWVRTGFRTRTRTWLESLSGSEPELEPAMKPKWVLNLNPNPLAIPYQVSNPGGESPCP